MNIRNNSEYLIGAALIHIETEHMSIDAVTSAQSDEEIQEVVNHSIAKGLNNALGDIPFADKLLYGLAHIGAEADSAEVNVVQPSIKSMKAFVAAIWSVITSGKMDEVDEYEKNMCPLPKEVKDYIKELISE